MNSTPSIPPSGQRWYYMDAQNRQQGPVSQEALSRLAAAGRINASTPIIEQGGSKWTTYGALFPASSRPQPLPPPSSEAKDNPPRFWPTALALVLCFPVGLFMLWRNKGVSRPVQIAITAVYGLIFLSMGASNNASSPSGSSSVFTESSSSTPAPTPERAAPYIVASKEEMPLENQLALVNANKGALPSDDVTINRFRYLLEKAAAMTGDTKKEIADQACKGQGLVRSNGKAVTVLEFMEFVNRFLASPGVPKMKYHDAVLLAEISLSE